MDSFSEQLFQLAGWGALVGFVILIIAGMSNKVVIYYDGLDLVWSISPFLFLFFGFLIANAMLPEVPPNTDLPSVWSQFSSACVVIVSILGSIFGVYKTFDSAIKHNGMALGIPIALLKAATSLLAALCAIGLFQDLKSAKNYRGFVFAILLLSFLGWFVKKLINGPAVYAARGALPPINS